MLCALTAAHAQRPAPGRDQLDQIRAQLGQLTLLQVPADVIAGELKLTGDQQAKVKAVQEKYQASLRGLREQQGGDRPSAALAEKLRETRASAQAEIDAILTAEQKTNAPKVLEGYRRIVMVGIPPQALGVLKLTDAQKTELMTIAKEAQDKMAALPPEERRTKGMDIRRDVRTRMDTVLTAEQKAALQKWQQEHRPQGRGGPPRS
jgi:Spy/CpxP family protein refolding chaperone